MKKLTKEQRKIYNFMLYSLRVNGTIILPPWMAKEAKEIDRKLGVAVDNRSTQNTYSDINLIDTSCSNA